MKLTKEHYQVIQSALGCLSKQSTCTFTNTLVDCAKQILWLHMNDEIEIDVEYNDGLLEMISPLNGQVE